MTARLPAASWPTAIWLMHPDIFAALIEMPLTSGSGIDFDPDPTGDAPCGRLCGRPVVPHEGCDAPGHVGDFMFVDPQQYLIVTRSAASNVASSIHVFFDQALVAFRLLMRFDGRPLWSRSVLSRVGGVERSPFIALGPRS